MTKNKTGCVSCGKCKSKCKCGVGNVDDPIGLLVFAGSVNTTEQSGDAEGYLTNSGSGLSAAAIDYPAPGAVSFEGLTVNVRDELPPDAELTVELFVNGVVDPDFTVTFKGTDTPGKKSADGETSLDLEDTFDLKGTLTGGLDSAIYGISASLGVVKGA